MDLSLFPNQQKQYKAGDFINYNGIQCIVTEKISFGPFDDNPDYVLCNLDTGKTFDTTLSDIYKYHKELPQVDLNLLKWDDQDESIEFDTSGSANKSGQLADFDVGDLSQVDDKENIDVKPTGDRFKTLSNADVDKIAEANEEQSTKRQTK